MDADEREIYDYLSTWGQQFVSAREICRRAGGKHRSSEDPDWAKPVLVRMTDKHILESDPGGRYRIKPKKKRSTKQKHPRKRPRGLSRVLMKTAKPPIGYLRHPHPKTCKAVVSVKVSANRPWAQSQRTLTGRDEITQAAMGARSGVSALKVEFLDVTVIVGPDRQSAVADLTAKAQVPGDKDFTVQELKFTLKKMDGEWLITRVETVKTLS